MKQIIKKIIPRNIKEYVRNNRYVWLDTVRCGGKRMCSLSYSGYKLFYERGTSLVNRIRFGKSFEPELISAIQKELSQEHPTFLDIGANIGLISLAVCSKVPRVHIIAFEPGPKQSSFLKKTIIENKLEKRISLHTQALSDTVGTVTFFTRTKGDVSKDGLANTGRGGEAEAIKVKTLTLDTWWQREGKPTFSVIKIDTEGAELMILRGGEAFMKEVKPVIFLEIEPRNLKAFSYTAFDILALLQERNYSLFTLEGDQCDKENIERMLEQSDTFIARPIL